MHITIWGTRDHVTLNSEPLAHIWEANPSKLWEGLMIARKAWPGYKLVLQFYDFDDE